MCIDAGRMRWASAQVGSTDHGGDCLVLFSGPLTRHVEEVTQFSSESNMVI